MSVGIRLFHSRILLKNYVLVKPNENQCFLYGLNKKGSIEDIKKPILKKTYEKYRIVREGTFPCSEIFKDFPHRYHIWKSYVPRNINTIPDYMGQSFSIKNRDGNNGLRVHISGAINNKGKIESVTKLQFPLSRYEHSYGITNLARIYLRKVFEKYSTAKPNPVTYYIDEKLDKTLIELDKEHNVPKFEVTDEIKKSINLLREKFGMT